MSASSGKHKHFALASADKTNLRTQFAAMCYRMHKGKVKFLLVTSRRTRSWIVPKGWPIAGKSAEATVATEAWEEAGVTGHVHARPIGMFSYIKEVDDAPDLPCVAVVYPMEVTEVAKRFPEREDRTRKWVSRKTAIEMIRYPELGPIIRDFDPLNETVKVRR